MQNYPSRVEWESAREPLRAHWLVVSNCASGISISAVSEKKGKIALSFFKKKSIIDHTQSTTCRWGEVKVKVSLWFYPRCCFIFFLSLSHSLTDCWLPISIFNRQQRCLLLSSCANINCAYLIIAVALCAVIMYFSSHFHALQSSSFIIIMLWLVNCFVIKCYLLHAIRTLIYMWIDKVR